MCSEESASSEKSRGSVGIIGVLLVFRHPSDGNPVGNLEERGENVLPAKLPDMPSMRPVLGKGTSLSGDNGSPVPMSLILPVPAAKAGFARSGCSAHALASYALSHIAETSSIGPSPLMCLRNSAMTAFRMVSLSAAGWASSHFSVFLTYGSMSVSVISLI